MPPDPALHKNRALDRIGGALERQNKLLEALNKNLVQMGREIVPAAQKLQKFFDEMNAHSEDVDTIKVGTAEELQAMEAKDAFDAAHRNCTSTVCVLDPGNVHHYNCPWRDREDPRAT